MEKGGSPRFKNEDAFWLIAVFLVLAFLFSLPYIVGAMLTPPGAKFLGLLRLRDDLAVYLSWMEQVRQGHILFVNLFTNMEQQHPFFNIFALLMGGLSKILHISPVKMLFVSRYLFALCLVFLLYAFLTYIFPERKMKRTGLLLLVFSSGVGWLTGGYSPARGIENSVDLWQPESTVFLSVYVNPLFSFSLIFILAFFLALLKWKNWKGGLLAGVSLLVLANAHTYDVVIVGVVWIFYVGLLWLRNKKMPWRDIGNALIALIIAAPALYYQIYLLRSEPLFSARAEVPTLSPSFWWYITGVGFLLPLAVWAIIKRVKEKKLDDVFLFLTAWAVAGFLLPYLPFSFQRKLFMGTQIPLAILATMAVAPEYITRYRNALPLLLFFLFPSNGVILATDIYSLVTNRPLYPQPTYLSRSEIEALNWLRDYTNPEEVILAIPDFACYIPALSGRRVYAGHWGETPDYSKKYKEVLRFYKDREKERREAFLREKDIEFVYYGNYESFLAPEFLNFDSPFLQLVFQNEEAKIWRVRY